MAGKAIKRLGQALRGRLGWVLRIVVTVGLFYVLFRYVVDPRKLLSVLVGVAAGWLVAAIVLKGVGILSSMARWNLLLRAQGIRAPFSHLASSFLVGRFVGMFLPSTLGLDGYRAYDIALRAQDPIRSVAVILVEKITGFFTLSLLVLLALPAGQHFLPSQLLLVVGVVFCLPVALAFLLLLRPGLFEYLLRWNWPGKTRIERQLRQAVASITAYRDHQAYLWLAVLLGLVVHGATVLMYYCTAQAVRANVSLPDMLFVGPLIIVATLVGPVIAGLAAREFTAVGLLQQISVGREQALLVGNLGFWCEALPAVLGGILLALRPASYRPVIEHTNRPAAPEVAAAEPAKTMAQPRPPFWKTAVLPSLSAGALAGSLVGIAEVVELAIGGHSLPYLSTLPYAVVLYGLLGAAAGLGLGIVIFLLWRTGDSLHLELAISRWAGALTFTGMALAVVRYRVVRDVYKEHLKTLSLTGLLVHAGLLLGGLALLVGILFLARRITRARPGLLLARGGSLLFVPVLLGGALLASTLVRAGDSSSPSGAISEQLAGAPNIIVIGADTLRADHLSCYGYPEQTSPAIDALAADGVRFTHAAAQSSWTKPSFATIMTSLYPSSHTAIYKDSRLPQAATTLAEVLQQAGYTTGGIADNINIAPVFGFDQGFDKYTFLEPEYPLGASATSAELAFYQLLRQVYARIFGEHARVENYYQPAEKVTGEALAWLEQNKTSRFFLFLHYMDAHDPYTAHPDDGRLYARAGNANPDPAMAATFSELYDSGIRHMDESLGELFAWLKKAGLYDNTLIVFTSDHGEEFQDHGGWWHGDTLYGEMTSVPLIIKYPTGARAGTTEEASARSLDIAPTVVDVAGLPIPSTWQGRSLWSSTTPPAYLFAEEDFEGNIIRSVQQGHWKLVLANHGNPRGLPAVALFDLSQDPGEQQNLAQAEPGWVETLRGTMHMGQVEALSQRLEAETGALDAEAEKLLHDLGY